VKINGEQKYLWRAVDQDGNALDNLLQSRRDKAAAGRFFRHLMKKTRTVPRVVVTARLRSYGAAHREFSTSSIASRLYSSEYRFVYLLPTWHYFLWNLGSQSPGVQGQGEASIGTAGTVDQSLGFKSSSRRMERHFSRR
jgi:hypothetical protein